MTKTKQGIILSTLALLGLAISAQAGAQPLTPQTPTKLPPSGAMAHIIGQMHPMQYLPAGRYDFYVWGTACGGGAQASGQVTNGNLAAPALPFSWHRPEAGHPDSGSTGHGQLDVVRNGDQISFAYVAGHGVVVTFSGTVSQTGDLTINGNISPAYPFAAALKGHLAESGLTAAGTADMTDCDVIDYSASVGGGYRPPVPSNGGGFVLARSDVSTGGTAARFAMAGFVMPAAGPHP